MGIRQGIPVDEELKVYLAEDKDELFGADSVLVPFRTSDLRGTPDGEEEALTRPKRTSFLSLSSSCVSTFSFACTPPILFDPRLATKQ